MPDNDPKRASRIARSSSPVIMSIGGILLPNPTNPIEDLHEWHELKEYIRREVKPVNNEHGISQFWANLDDHKCCRYIDHLKKVLSRRMVMLLAY
jgi:hypothetical protein